MNKLFIILLSIITINLYGQQLKVRPHQLNLAPLYIDTLNSRVGIGTTSPSYKLDVNGDIRLENGKYIYYVTGTGGTGQMIGTVAGSNTVTINRLTSAATTQIWGSALGKNFEITGGSSSETIFLSNGTEHMRINSSGNVGIGTTTPEYSLDIQGISPVLRIADNRVANAADASAIWMGENGSTEVRGAGIIYNGSSNTLNLVTSDNGTLADGNPFNAAVRVTIRETTGNVGIGTTNPTSKLTVNLAPNTGGGVSIQEGTTIIADIGDGGSTANVGLLRLYDAGVEKVRLYAFQSPNWINNGSNFGIGTITPAYKLDAYQGDVATTGHSYGDLRLSGNLTGYVNNTFPTLRTSGDAIYFDAKNTYTGYIAYNTGFIDVSDGTFKTFVEPIQNATDILMNLEGVRYSWIDGRDNFETHAGFVAQQVLEHYPEAVTLAETGIYGISSPPLIALAVTTIQEQQQQIEELKTTIQSLITRIQILEQK